MTRRIEFATKGQVTAFDFYPNSFPAYQTDWPFLEAEALSITAPGDKAPRPAKGDRKYAPAKLSQL